MQGAMFNVSTKPQKKRNKTKNNQINFIKPIYKIATLVGIAPGYNFETHVLTQSTYYSFVVLLVTCGLYGYGIRGKFLYDYPTQTGLTYVATSFLSATISMLCSVTLVICGGIKYSGEFQVMFVNFDEIDQKLGTIPLKTSHYVRLYTEIIVFYTIVLVQSCYNVLTNWFLYSEIEVYNTIRKPLLFINLSACLLIRYISKQLGLRYKLLNTQITLYNEKVSERKCLYWAYMKLHQNVVLFNRIFGWQILAISVNFVISMLFSINVIIIEMDDDDSASVHFWINNLLHVISNLVLCIPFASSCNGAAEAAKLTSILTYSLLSQKHLVSDKYIRKDLTLLASVPWPGFSAAGFFDVDHTMLFTLFGSVTSYLIVLIQLKDMRM